MDFDDDEIEAITESDLFDVSDVTWDVKQTKNKCKIYLIAESDTPFNLMKFYLALKEYTFRIESELGVMSEAPEEH